MFDRVRTVVSYFLPSKLGKNDRIEFGVRSYSQEGEDRLLTRMMDRDSSPACYVDVGCNHPFRMSNTAFFYERGWEGVAIDPNPEFKAEFERLRPRDHFIHCGVGSREAELTFFRFEESLYNTFDQERATWIAANHSRALPNDQVRIRPLKDILREVWPEGRQIRLLSIDCEGMDIDVLLSHDFDRYPVEFICIEIDCVVMDGSLDPTVEYLQERGFSFISKLCKTAILLRTDRLTHWGLQ